MTPIHLILGDSGPAVLFGGIVLAAVLMLVAATIEIALERAGGPDPAQPPDWVAERGPALFLFVAMPALALAFTLATGLTLTLGSNPDETGLSRLWPVVLTVAAIVAAIAGGVGAPLAQHWGLGIAVFGLGVSAIFPLLYVANALPFGSDGSLPYPPRLVFGLVVGLIVVAIVVAGAALVSLAVTVVRCARDLRVARRGSHRGRRLRTR
jgi:hypothetical protein